jgi:putative chitinase
MSIKDLQTKIGVTADGAFGKGTLQAAAKFFNLTNNRAAHFFAQTAHETGDFRLFSENLNYSAEGLLGTFKKYFPDTATASKYAHNKVMIANKVYANRMGNGDEASGDGWTYRGRGAIQLTGKANYQAFSSHINRPDVMTNPDIVATELAFESAIFFFDKNNLWTICDKGVDDSTITIVSKRINGGTLGLEDRKSKTKKYAMLIQ